MSLTLLKETRVRESGRYEDLNRMRVKAVEMGLGLGDNYESAP